MTATGPLPFAALQKRITRKSVPKALLREAPVILMAYDLLEDGGYDLRATPFAERRARLDALVDGLAEGCPCAPRPRSRSTPGRISRRPAPPPAPAAPRG